MLNDPVSDDGCMLIKGGLELCPTGIFSKVRCSKIAFDAILGMPLEFLLQSYLQFLARKVWFA